MQSSHTSPPALGRAALYAGTGPELTRYEVDTEHLALVKRESMELPANVQYAWPHASKRFLYVGSSDRVAVRGGPLGKVHHATAFRIDPDSGRLEQHGHPVPLRGRPIHLTTDRHSRHLLVAYAKPSGLSIHRINDDGTIGDEVPQRAAIDVGVYAHQIRVVPENNRVILVTRGHGEPYEAGALKVFRYKDGLLGEEVSINPEEFERFGPRHLDFHPSKPWLYVSLEDQHQLCMFSMANGQVSAGPLFTKNTLTNPGNLRPFQYAGTVHMHPNGHFVYVAERASGTVERSGRAVHAGGENAIVVYRIDAATGEPTLIQHAATAGLHPRTFALDAEARILVAANKAPVPMPDGKIVPASLDVFRVGSDGRLTYTTKYDVDVSRGPLWWMGMLTL